MASSFVVRLDEADLKRFDALADRERMPRETLARHLLLEYIRQREEPVHIRPCIISVGLNPDDAEEIKEGLKHLHTLFSYVSGEQKSDAYEAICAGPKNGLSYDEAFIIVQKRYFDVGWVYADAVN